MRELKAQIRKEVGKKSKALRKAGFLPAVIYGEGIVSQPISLSRRDFEKAYGEIGESTVLTLDVGGKPYDVLIHDIASHPLTGSFLHADFYAIRMDKAIRTKVPIEFSGESPAVKNFGGVLVKVISELEIEAMPRDLPRLIAVDISSLTELESRLMIKDILFPQGVKVLANIEEIVALVETPRSEEELVELKTPVSATPVEVKTERETKAAEKAEKNISEEVPSSSPKQ